MDNERADQIWSADFWASWASFSASSAAQLSWQSKKVTVTSHNLGHLTLLLHTPSNLKQRNRHWTHNVGPKWMSKKPQVFLSFWDIISLQTFSSYISIFSMIARPFCRMVWCDLHQCGEECGSGLATDKLRVTLWWHKSPHNSAELTLVSQICWAHCDIVLSSPTTQMPALTSCPNPAAAATFCTCTLFFFLLLSVLATSWVCVALSTSTSSWWAMGSWQNVVQ